MQNPIYDNNKIPVCVTVIKTINHFAFQDKDVTNQYRTWFDKNKCFKQQAYDLLKKESRVFGMVTVIISDFNKDHLIKATEFQKKALRESGFISEEYHKEMEKFRLSEKKILQMDCFIKKTVEVQELTEV